MFSTKIQVNWPFGSGEEANNRFQDGGHSVHLWFPIGPILAIVFDIQVTPMFPTKFQVKLPLGKAKKRKVHFHDGRQGGHFGFPIGTILSIFDLQVTLMFLRSVKSTGLLVQ